MKIVAVLLWICATSGLALGVAAKLALAFYMLAVFVAARFMTQVMES